MEIRKFLNTNRIIFDGAIGTYYDTLNKFNIDIVEKANFSNKELIERIHTEYIESGANLIRTNTFSTNNMFFSKDEIKENIISAVEIARNSVKKSKKDVFIGADIGPIKDSSDRDVAKVLEEYKYIVDIFLNLDIKIFIFETFSNLYYIKQIADYIKQKDENIFIIAQFSFNSYGFTKDGISIDRMVKEISEINVDSFGFNCGVGASHLYNLIKNIKFPDNKYVTALPNAGYPTIIRGRAIYSDNVEYYGKIMEKIEKLGVRILGGCCGTTPAHIKNVYDRLKDKPITIRKYEEVLDKEVSIAEKKINSFIEKLNNNQKVIAVELDPPFDVNIEKILNGSKELKECDVDIVTFADSPMAKSRADSILVSSKILNDVGINVMPHIACRDKNTIALRSQILGAYINDIRNLLIVTGDPVLRDDREVIKSVFDFNSIKLMNYVKQMNIEHFKNDEVYYGGALNYSGVNVNGIIERMKKKIDAGAKYFLTQPIYSNEDIERIEYIKSHLDCKILCGIMPLVSYKNARFMKNEMAGINVPDEIIEKYRKDMTREEAEDVAVNISVDLVEKLYDIGDGFYFMTPFNRVSMIKRIVNFVKERENL